MTHPCLAYPIETRPCDGVIEKGDAVVASERRRDGKFTVRKALGGELPLGVALSPSHLHGYVAMVRVDAD